MGLWTLLLFPLVVVLGMFAENGNQRNLRTEQMVAARARAVAQYQATLIAQRLNNQFVDLHSKCSISSAVRPCKNSGSHASHLFEAAITAYDGRSTSKE